MDRAKAKALLPIITAYADGKNVEIMTSKGSWCVIQCPDFMSDASDYRINPGSSRDDYISRHDACGLKIGDRVRVVRSAMDMEDGWGAVWNEAPMDQTVKKLGIIVEDRRGDGFLVKVDSQKRQWHYPYFVLEKVECKCRPFANAEEFKPHRKKWIVGKLKSIETYENIRFRVIGVGEHAVVFGMRVVGWVNLLSEYEFEDGSPCGILLQDDSTET